MATTVAEKRGKVGKKSRYIRVGAGFADENPLRAKLRGNTGGGDPLIRDGDGIKLRVPERGFLPSEAWVDTYFDEIADRDPEGHPILLRRYDRNTVSPLSSSRRTPTPKMIRCPKCGRKTPPQAMETPWTYPNRANPLLELLCALPPASAAPVALLAEDLGMGLSRALALLERLRRVFGIQLFRDSNGDDHVLIPERNKARVAAAAESYWDKLEHAPPRAVLLTPICADCRATKDHRFYGKSSSAAIMRRIADLHAPPDPFINNFLKTESKSQMGIEIKRHKMGKWKPTKTLD